MARQKIGKADLETLGRKSAAQNLRRQIDDLVGGNAPARPSSLRDFIDRKMAERRRDNRKETVD
jgi:hypothetical protein